MRQTEPMAKKGKKRAADVDTKPPASMGSKQAWKIMDRGSSFAASAAARELPTLLWRVGTGRKPPKATGNPDVNLREALLWSFVGGGVAEMTRVVVKRWTARYWVKSTGHLPPGMKPLKSDAIATPTPEEVAEDQAR